MNILLQGNIAVSGVEYLKEFSEPNWSIYTWTPENQSLEEFDELAKDATVMIGGNIPRDHWPAVPALRLFQIPWAGYNHTGPEKMPASIPVCNCFEHESSIAEYVMLAMLEWEIRLGRMDTDMRKHGWNGRVTGLSGNFHGEVAGKTVGFVGYGHIAQAVARRASAFDMKLIAVRRNASEKNEELDWLGSSDELPRLLEKSDFVVIACDLNEATRNLFDEKTIARMKPDAVLINVSRGGIVDETALYEALHEKRIGGAVIDTWYNYNQKGKPEVSPYNHPFEQLDNILMSAHECGWTIEQVKRRWQFIAENIKRAEQGVAPENQVFVGSAPTGIANTGIANTGIANSGITDSP